MAKAPAPKPKKEKNPPPVEDDEDDDLQKDEEKEDSKKGGGKLNLKLILMIAGAVFVTAGLTAGLMMFLVGGGSPPPPATEGSEAGMEHGAQPAAIEAPQRSGGHGAPPAESGGHGGGGGHGGDGEAGQTEPGGPVNIKFESFIVNLNDLGGRRMLKLTMSVDADNKDLADEINAKMPQFRDTILLLLSSIQSDDVSSLDGKQRLKNQMLNRMNPNLTQGKIRDLYFLEMVVQ
jgi:flagellar FliL protein